MKEKKMKKKILPAALLLLLIPVGCKDLVTGNKTILRVSVDLNCSTRLSYATVTIDGISIGDVTPGSSGESSVSPGDHYVEALSTPGGVRWGPIRVNAPEGYTTTESLTCR